MWGRLARWWDDVKGRGCADCGLDIRDASDAAFIWQEDRAVIAAAAALAKTWDTARLLKEEKALYEALWRRQERLDAR